MSRQLASNGNSNKVDVNAHQVVLSTQNEEESKINNKNNNHSSELFTSLRACSMLISRWGCAAPINEHDLLKVMHRNT